MKPIHPIIKTLREKRIERGIPQVILAETMGYDTTVVAVGITVLSTRMAIDP